MTFYYFIFGQYTFKIHKNIKNGTSFKFGIEKEYIINNGCSVFKMRTKKNKELSQRVFASYLGICISTRYVGR